MKTTTTDLSKYSKCLIRGRLVANTPEERVRQRLIQKMIAEWGYPRGLISVERGVGERRYDLVCYSQSMKPLVLIECKAVDLNESTISQAFGYNLSIKAPFICLASPNEIKTFWQEGGKIASVPFLPVYHELDQISRRL